MTHDQTMQAARAIAKSYWCPFCLDRSVAAMSTSGPHALRRFRSCRAHGDLYQQKRCPCGAPWAHCLACMDARVDPRAGAAFCPACRRRHGAAARHCACRRAAAGPAWAQPSSPEDDDLASDSYLHDIPHH